LAKARSIVSASASAEATAVVAPGGNRKLLWNSPFDLHHLLVELMEWFQQNIVHCILRIKSDEAKPTRPLSIVVIHYNHICNSTKLREIVSEVIFSNSGS
jgi:hypothetical protein